MRLRRTLFALGFSTMGILLGCSGGGDGGPVTPPPPDGNHAPTVNLNIDKAHVAYNETAQLSVTSSDVDGDQVTFGWTAAKGTVTTSGPTSTTATFKAGAQWGQASATVNASDGKGGSAQATALTYVRNPNPPAFAFAGTSSANCGPGTSNPTAFILRLTPAESVLLTFISIYPRDGCTSCGTSRNYSSPIVLGAGQAYSWTDAFCFSPSCCENSGCGNCGYWTITIQGRRPEPDGGTFSFECHSWNPAYPTSSCN
jgi:hypothetical protein